MGKAAAFSYRLPAWLGFVGIIYGVPLHYKKGVITMGVLRQIAEYFYLKKRDPNAPNTKWMKYMHGINRISLFMFIVAVIIIILKLTVFKK